MQQHQHATDLRSNLSRYCIPPPEYQQQQYPQPPPPPSQLQLQLQTSPEFQKLMTIYQDHHQMNNIYNLEKFGLMKIMKPIQSQEIRL